MKMTVGAILRADRAAARLFTTAAAVFAVAGPERQRAARIRQVAAADSERRHLLTPTGESHLAPR